MKKIILLVSCFILLYACNSNKSKKDNNEIERENSNEPLITEFETIIVPIPILLFPVNVKFPPLICNLLNGLVIPIPTFFQYEFACDKNSGNICYVELNDFVFNKESMINTIDKKTKYWVPFKNE